MVYKPIPFACLPKRSCPLKRLYFRYLLYSGINLFPLLVLHIAYNTPVTLQKVGIFHLELVSPLNKYFVVSLNVEWIKVTKRLFYFVQALTLGAERSITSKLYASVLYSFRYYFDIFQSS